MRDFLLGVYQWICDRVSDLDVGLCARYLNRHLGAQIEFWELKLTSGTLNRRLGFKIDRWGAQIDVWELKSTSGRLNPCMGAQTDV